MFTALREMGIVDLEPPDDFGTPMDQIVDFIRKNVKSRGVAAL